MNIFQRWGKSLRPGPPHVLPFHLLDVAAVLAVGLERRPRLLAALAEGLGMAPEDARAMLLTLLALHDIGKVAVSFQALNVSAAKAVGLGITGKKPYPLRHDALGQAILCAHLPALTTAAGWPADLPTWLKHTQLLALATGHHGRPPAKTEPLGLLRRAGLLTSDDAAIGCETAVAVAGLFSWCRGLPDPDGLDRLSPLLNGLFTLCDWLGSHASIPYQSTPEDLDTYWRTKALPKAADLLDMVAPALFRELPPQPPASFVELFPALTRDGVPPVPTPLQALADRLFTAEALPDGPLLVVIEDLTGSGKTEAGDLIVQRLVAFGRANGAYVGLPTMVTADKAFARKFVPAPDADVTLPFGDALFRQTPQTVLAHSRRLRSPLFRQAPTRAGVEEGDGHAAAWFVETALRSLLAELGVGTVDQALAGALRARFATVRLAGLWRKVLVVDEVHAYDSYMQALLESLLRWQGRMGDPVVLMSATLPSGPRAALIRAYAQGAGWEDVAAMTGRTRPGAYPLLTLVSQQGIAQHPVDPPPGPGTRPVRFEAVHSEAAVETRIAAWLAAGRSVIWFRNTVADAVAAWERLAGYDPLLYHARYLPADRADRDAAVDAVFDKNADPAARRGRLLIATQAAEQSLDLDADEMVMDLAPADSLIQRLGRRRRHARTSDGALSPDRVERRPDGGPVVLLTPPLDAPVAGWYARLFPRAAKVYRDDARLWLSALYLLHPERLPDGAAGDGAFVPARDVRALMEAVYAPEPQGVPPALLARHDAAEGEMQAERQLGTEARLPFSNGFGEDWGDGSSTPDTLQGEPRTRLIDSHTVVLAVVEGGVPRLLGLDPDGAPSIEDSQCRSPVSPALPKDHTAWDEALSATLTREQGKIRDRGCVVFLTRRDGEVWFSDPLPDVRNQRIRYCPRRGLALIRGGEADG